MTPAERAVRGAIGRRGPIPFAAVVDLALYDEDGGFYSTGGQAGRRGDFLTSPEVGPLFGAVVAGALDTWWDQAGRPDEWTVVGGRRRSWHARPHGPRRPPRLRAGAAVRARRARRRPSDGTTGSTCPWARSAFAGRPRDDARSVRPGRWS